MKRNTRLAIFLILIFSVVIRVTTIDFKDYWLDESFSIENISLSPAEMIKSLKSDTMPPLYFILLKIWAILTGKLLHLRVFSTLWSILSILLIYLIGKKIFNENTAILSAIFLAVNPFNIDYSQELRMYTMYPALLLAGVLFLIYSFENGRVINWFFFSLFNTLAIYTHYHSFFFIITEFIFFLILIFRKYIVGSASATNFLNNKIPIISVKKILLSILFHIILILPLLPLMFYQSKANLSNIMWVPKPKLIDLFSVYFIHFPFYRNFTDNIFFWFLSGGIYFIILLGLKFKNTEKSSFRTSNFPNPVLFISLLSFMPVIFMFFISLLTPFRCFLPYRYVIISLIPAILLISYCISRLPFVISLVLSIIIILLQLYFSVTNILITNKPHWKDLTQIIDQNVKESDTLIALPKHWAKTYYNYSKKNHPILEFKTFFVDETQNPEKLFLLFFHHILKEDEFFPGFLPFILDLYSQSHRAIYSDQWFTFNEYENLNYSKVRFWLKNRKTAGREYLFDLNPIVLFSPEDESFQNNSSFGPLQLSTDFLPYRWTRQPTIELIQKKNIPQGRYIYLTSFGFDYPETFKGAFFQILLPFSQPFKINEPGGFYRKTLFLDIPMNLNEFKATYQSTLWMPSEFHLGLKDDRTLGFHFFYGALIPFKSADKIPDGVIYSIDVGSKYDEPFVNNTFYEREGDVENSFRWTKANAWIRIPIFPSLPLKEKKLILKMTNSILNPQKKFPIEIFWNEKSLEKLTLTASDKRDYEFSLIDTDIKVDNILRIETPGWCPAKLGISNDDRELGVIIFAVDLK